MTSLLTLILVLEPSFLLLETLDMMLLMILINFSAKKTRYFYNFGNKYLVSNALTEQELRSFCKRERERDELYSYHR